MHAGLALPSSYQGTWTLASRFCPEGAWVKNRRRFEGGVAYLVLPEARSTAPEPRLNCALHMTSSEPRPGHSQSSVLMQGTAGTAGAL